MSALSVALSWPGLLSGIVCMMYEKSSDTVRPAHSLANELPVDGAWQLRQRPAYTRLPRVACSTVYTPASVDVESVATAVCAGAGRLSMASAPRIPMV